MIGIPKWAQELRGGPLVLKGNARRVDAEPEKPRPHPCQDYLDALPGCKYRLQPLHVCRICRDIWVEVERTVHGDGGDADVMTMVRLSEVMEE